MKKFLIIFFFIISIFMLMSCTGSIFKKQKYEDFDDHYQDVLPENTEDGLVLHAFCWSFNDIKNNLQAIKDAGFKSVLTMPIQEPKNGGATWWSFYQPLSFTIAKSTTLGTKEEFISLCEEADNLGISILVDVIANHMATISDDSKEADGTPTVSPQVEKFEKVIYQNRNSDVDGNGITFHHNKNASGSGAETQVYPYGNLPDLNTSNKYVQERVLSFLKECIDAGADGFRFDAAKHIETSKDPDYPSFFWENTLDVAKEYYHNLTNKELFVYGEVLNLPIGRSVDLYTSHMYVTEDAYVSQFKTVITTKNAEKILDARYSKGSTPSDLIAWVESHDDFTSSTTHFSESKIGKLWAILASRKDLKGIFLARPNDDLICGTVGSLGFESNYVISANLFHNRFLDAEEYLSAKDSIFINERVNGDDVGALIVDFSIKSSKDSEVKVSLPHLENGNYYDTLTGNKVVVTKHSAKIKFDASGMCFLVKTPSMPRPTLKVDYMGGLFSADKKITAEISNYEEAYYTYNDETETHILNNKSEISLLDHISDSGKVKLTICVKNGNIIISREYNYQKVELIGSYFNVYNINPNYFTDYEVYIWSWEPGTWSKNYQVENGVMLVDTTGMTGFLLAIFEKGYTPTDIHLWDEAVIKQSVDIKGTTLTTKFYDAGGF